ncbi:hypothetical protein ACS0TY_014923 [Phlomoides rotata]
MGSKTCMNEACRETASSEFKNGWSLRSGGFAKLCFKCGSAYENSVFCETFHSDESGWRECRICGKIVHCGCIASRNLYEYMQFGGVACISCAKRIEINSPQPTQIPADVPSDKFVTKSSIRVGQPVVIENRTNDEKFSTERLMQLTKAIGFNHAPSAVQKIRREESMPKTAESTKNVQNLSLHCSTPAFLKAGNSRPKQGAKDMFESLAKPSLNFSFTTPLGGSSTALSIYGGTVEGSEQSKSSYQHGQKSRHISNKPPKPSPTTSPDTNKGALSQMRIPRPPAEGRGRSQLLPRYWPRITDQELQLLSGELNASIVPLFEKILSASDAGRIGRLVLPKACAEAYFPTINQSEGIPIRIQDIKGKEWTFQFRFWPNNNSRMYVLEGVTPCIQCMQLQAGDTVIFSRRDPGGQLVIGCRKAINNVDVQDSLALVPYNNDSQGETSFSGVADTPQLSNGGRVSDDSQQRRMAISEKKKKSRNIKNKRLLTNNDDASELRITFEEAQELFRPAPSAQPTVFMVDDCEFEEFDEPPVFGKRPTFISRPSGEQEQLAQCDSCSKWRRVPVDALLPAKWTCSDNVWDSSRCSCSAPEDVNTRDLDFSAANKDNKKQKMAESRLSREGEPSGLDALANAAVLGADNLTEVGDFSAGATTRHPRHRPGCTCIVCIQPPSGKGKHEPTCKCNVCLTVKRRFKTLMIRKKKRQLEREAELAHARDKLVLDDKDEDIAGLALLNMHDAEHETVDADLEEANTGRLDLNCDPHREDDVLAEAGESLTILMITDGSAVDVHPEQNGGEGVSQTMHDGVARTTSDGVEENGTVALAGDGEEEKEKQS